MSLLIIGGTGTLGRQVVLQALTKGYQVRCLVRNFRKASFLKEWGVELVYGDLSRPETIPPCLKGITAIIDASTSRPNEQDSLKKVDWDAEKVKQYIYSLSINKDAIQSVLKLAQNAIITKPIAANDSNSFDIALISQ